ncbi:MAG: DNA/RNA non-specific endonuclease [Methanobacterium sp.]|nr:DNA/RNA non-specific endonuclease [Methanobacterium sp.]
MIRCCMRSIYFVLSILLALLFALPAFAGCPVLDETGTPALTAPADTTLVCHKGYAASVDNAALVPRWVAYKLTADHTLGCNIRENNFHPDEFLTGRRAVPADYAKSGYDKGHQAPAEDFAFDAALLSDSFSMANMAPQLPGLNRAGWERLEETVRVWAWSRGAVVVLVGPFIGPNPPTIGHGVTVPDGFWKVLFDPATGEALAFAMPQQPVAKGPLEPWETTVAEGARRAGVMLPLPATVDRAAKPALWLADVRKWHLAKKKACAGE